MRRKKLEHSGTELISARFRKLHAAYDKLAHSDETRDAFEGSELAIVAACYASVERIFVLEDYGNGGKHFVDPLPSGWVDKRQFKEEPYAEPHLTAWERQRVKMLAYAGALIALEIDRLLARLRVKGVKL